MLLKLLIKRNDWYCLAEEEVCFHDEKLSWEGNFEMREKLTRLMSEKLKIEYQKALENSEWQILLIAESKVRSVIESMEEEKKLNIKRILKIA